MNLLKEIDQLRYQLKSSIELRDQEREQANNEQGVLLDKIAQMESAVAMGDTSANKESHQMVKLLNHLKHELKTKQAELIAAKDILTQTQIQKVAVETKL